ncbi:LacI family DNA-binding transcriptional regulator [Curtobacterium ammoniigenes]|uniref:LacI family DNA-binding transcriptional regulator n=1 Tax=Curtobacterium ammoniigenes TaxID=395387 RepID=UPI00083289DE|nr:substrate-binding domain-containing protein [Curtobacterium ammoniigenes]
MARLAGVSHQTVSRVVKGQPHVSDEVRARVTAAIEYLNYRPNQSARSLATSRSNRIGAIAYELRASGPSAIVEAASARARDRGYVLDIVSLDPGSDAGIADAITLVTQSHLAGVLAFTPTQQVVEALNRAHFSVPISLESESDDGSAHASHTGEDGVDLMIDHLAGLGHRRMFLIGGPDGWLAAEGRSRAYLRSLAERGLTSVGSVPGDWSAQSGYDGAARMPLDAGITAVVAANDQTALGAIAALTERGLRVPDDISVVGFDDIPESRFFQPALTTVRYDFASQGRLLTDRLIARIEGEQVPDAGALAPPAAVIRASSAPARTR